VQPEIKILMRFPEGTGLLLSEGLIENWIRLAGPKMFLADFPFPAFS
jgi:hypothetical protein